MAQMDAHRHMWGAMYGSPHTRHHWKNCWQRLDI